MNNLWFWMSVISALLLGIQIGFRFEKNVPAWLRTAVILIWFIVVVVTYIKTR